MMSCCDVSGAKQARTHHHRRAPTETHATAPPGRTGNPPRRHPPETAIAQRALLILTLRSSREGKEWPLIGAARTEYVLVGLFSHTRRLKGYYRLVPVSFEQTHFFIVRSAWIILPILWTSPLIT